MHNDKFAPDVLSKITRHAIAPLWAVYERSPYLNHLKYLEKSQFRPIDQVKEDQWMRFKRLLNHAYSNTSYYAERMNESGLSPNNIKTWDDLVKLPLLTKDDIRNSTDKMIPGTINKGNLYTARTSGSTGIALVTYCDDDSMQFKRACTIRHDRWAGWDIGERIGALWGNPPHKKNWRSIVRGILLDRKTYLNTIKMTEDDLFQFYNKIRVERPTLLYGHAHSLYLFAQFLQSRGITDIKPRGIIATAMVLHDFERKTIEEVFDCKVTNRYGSEEVSLIACECSKHNGLHINCDALIVEFIKDGKPVKAGEPGAIVITDLTNYAMPYIRYKIGDVGIPSDQLCSCGCTYPLIASLEGRVADYVVTPDGSCLSGISLDEHFFLHFPEIKQMQIVQEKIDYLVLRVVKGDGFTDQTLNNIGSLVVERFGAKMKHSVEIVDSIQQEQSGKYRFCISKVKNPFS